MAILDEVFADRSQRKCVSVNQPFLRLMTSAVPVSDSRALTPYSATPASKVLGEEIAATLSCRTGKEAEDAPESVLPQQARQDILYGSGRLAPYAGGGAS